ncbi:hypothetical protein AAVH_11476 [Aphelenchoides avenae]|nr:hypothetical protein AAVH_11476 [Aphelenchus avenae]
MLLPVARAFKLTEPFAKLSEEQRVSGLHRILTKYINEECEDRGEAGATRIELIDVGSGAMVERRGDDAIGGEELWTIAKSFIAQPEVKYTGEPVLLLIHAFKK